MVSKIHKMDIGNLKTDIGNLAQVDKPAFRKTDSGMC